MGEALLGSSVPPSSTTEPEGTKKNAGDSELTSLITKEKPILPVIQQEITRLTQIGLKSSGSSKRDSVGTESISISTLYVGSMPLFKPLESSVPLSTVAKLESVGTVPGSSVPSSSTVGQKFVITGANNNLANLAGSTALQKQKQKQGRPKFLETQIVWCYLALHAMIFEDKVGNSEIMTIHHFSAKHYNPKHLNVLSEDVDPINADDLSKLVMLWPSLESVWSNEAFWNRQYEKSGTGMKRGQYFSKVIEIYLDFTKKLTFKRNYKMTVADFEDHLTGMVPAKCCRILLVKANQIVGLEILGDDIYLLLSLRAAVRIDPPFSVYNFVVWVGDGKPVKVYGPGPEYMPMMDKNSNFVIVPCGTITEVIAAAQSPVEALVT